MKIALFILIPIVIVGIGLVALVFILGGGPTNQEVIDKHRGDGHWMRTKFTTIATRLRNTGSVKGLSEKKVVLPKPVHDVRKEEFNTEIVMASQLSDPDLSPFAKGDFDLQASTILLTCLQWAGPKNPMGPDALRQSGGLDKKFKDALDYRYLVALRPVRHVRPRAMGKDLIDPASVDLEGFLVNLQTLDILGAFRIQAESDPKGTYVYKEGEDASKRMEEWAHSTLTTNARKKVAEALTQISGGTFVLER